MELKIWGRAEDVQELVAPLVDYMGEKLRIIVEPCPIEENEPRRFYVEVEKKKDTESKMWKGDVSWIIGIQEGGKELPLLSAFLAEK